MPSGVWVVALAQVSVKLLAVATKAKNHAQVATTR